ncbi:MAG: class I SAM-dependent methyltransferase [Acidimicrobiales bacterium]
MSTKAAYDEIADWYEAEFLANQRSVQSEMEFADLLGIDQGLVDLLGPGTGTCLEVGCGTGIYAKRIRSLGWTPVGVDISAGMLRHSRGRLPAAQGDAYTLPFAANSCDAVAAVMVHTDMADYKRALTEVFRVLQPGGRFVHIGVHPCFCGDFAERDGFQSAVIGSGYLEPSWKPGAGLDDIGTEGRGTEGRGTEGREQRDGVIRDKVGASHQPLSMLLNSVTDQGFRLERFAEGAAPLPITLSFVATKQSYS